MLQEQSGHQQGQQDQYPGLIASEDADKHELAVPVGCLSLAGLTPTDDAKDRIRPRPLPRISVERPGMDGLGTCHVDQLVIGIRPGLLADAPRAVQPQGQAGRHPGLALHRWGLFGGRLFHQVEPDIRSQVFPLVFDQGG